MRSISYMLQVRIACYLSLAPSPNAERELIHKPNSFIQGDFYRYLIELLLQFVVDIDTDIRTAFCLQ